MKELVVVRREWKDATIVVGVSDDGISIIMSLDDFINALVAEAGNPTLLVTSEALRQRLILAADTVVAGMKNETRRVM